MYAKSQSHSKYLITSYRISTRFMDPRSNSYPSVRRSLIIVPVLYQALIASVVRIMHYTPLC